MILLTNTETARRMQKTSSGDYATAFIAVAAIHGPFKRDDFFEPEDKFVIATCLVATVAMIAINLIF